MEWVVIFLPIVISIASAIWTTFIWKRQKHMEESFARSKSAYDIILNKEFTYYEKIDEIYADLIPRIHDIIDNLTNSSGLSMRQEQVKENFLAFLESIPKLKKELLIYDIYLPEQVRKTNSCAIQIFQSSLPFLSDEVNKLFERDENKINITACHEKLNVLLLNCAVARSSILSRLQDLANLKIKSKKQNDKEGKPHEQ